MRQQSQSSQYSQPRFSQPTQPDRVNRDQPSQSHGHTIGIVGTDTSVGKTHITSLLTTGLRQLGHQVWIHKPVACGDWQDNQAEDSRRLRPLLGDGQPEETLCRYQWPEAASPHLAAQAANDPITSQVLIDDIKTLQQQAGKRWLLIEGAGGVLVPLCQDDATVLDIASACAIPLILVTRPHLGTLNHSLLTIEAIRARGLTTIGVIINEHEPIERSLATACVETELERLAGVRILGRVPFGAAQETILSQETAKHIATQFINLCAEPPSF